jgi:serine/threonine-protein kinase
VWIIDLERATAGRLTFGASFEALPLWSPDGEHIIYSMSAPDGGIFSREANGTGSPELISKNAIARAAVSISPDGEHLIMLDNLNNESDMYSLSLSGESFPQPFIVTPFDDDSAEISPDGRYVAYESNETGTNQIYVRTFPNPDAGRWQISSDTGLEPKWHPDGSKLFFRDTQGSIAVVDVRTDPSFSAGQPRTYVTPQFSYGRYAYDVSPTDNRLLMIKGIDDSGANSAELTIESRLAIVENWFEELKRIVPTDAAQ